MTKRSYVQLGNIINLRRGHDLTKEEMVSGDIPVVGSNGIIGFHNVSTTSNPCLTVGRSGSVGVVNYIESSCWAHNTTLYVDDFKGNHPKYVYYLLKNLDLAYLHSGSVVPSLNRNYLHPLRVPHTKDVKEQERLAAVLSAIDAKIELNKRISSELGAMTKMLYNYWFIQFDFPDDESNPYKTSGGKMEYNAILKRKIPKNWECLELSKIAIRIATGLNPRQNFVLGKGSNYYVTIKNIEDGEICLDEKCDKIDDESLAIINKRSDLRVGDILFTSIEPVGTTYLIQEQPINWNINESVFTIRPNYDFVTSEYLYLLLSGDEIKSFTKNVSTGSIHKGVRIEVLNTYKVAYSNKSLINKYSIKIGPLLKRIDVLQKENRELTHLKDFILPMLMNGQLKVP